MPSSSLPASSDSYGDDDYEDEYADTNEFAGESMPDATTTTASSDPSPSTAYSAQPRAWWDQHKQEWSYEQPPTDYIPAYYDPNQDSVDSYQQSSYPATTADAADSYYDDTIASTDDIPDAVEGVPRVPSSHHAPTQSVSESVASSIIEEEDNYEDDF